MNRHSYIDTLSKDRKCSFNAQALRDVLAPVLSAEQLLTTYSDDPFDLLKSPSFKVRELSEEMISEQWVDFNITTRRSTTDREGFGGSSKRLQSLQQKLLTSIAVNNRVFRRKMELLHQQSMTFIQMKAARLEAKALMHSIENKRAFLRSLMNDVRTPLSVLTMSIESSQSLIENTDLIKLSCHHIAAVLDNYAAYENWAGDEVTELTPELLNLATIVESVAAQYQTFLEFSGISLQLDLELARDAEVYVDKRSITRVLENLLCDAFKYSNAGSSIQLVANMENACVRLELRDRDHDLSENSFQSINAYSDYTASVLDGDRGTGIGVFVAKMLLLRQNGSFGAAKFDSGGGSIIYFTLPLALSQATEKRHDRSMYPLSTPSISQLQIKADLISINCKLIN